MNLRKSIFQFILVVAGVFLFVSAAIAYGVNDKVQVQWKGSWYPATVMQVKQEGTVSKYFIHYDGYSNSWDEWVGDSRIKSTGFAVGDSVQVQWKGSWYPATIVKLENKKYFIHYEGYDKSWDEWVGTDRIRKK